LEIQLRMLLELAGGRNDNAWTSSSQEKEKCATTSSEESNNFKRIKLEH